MRIEKFYTSYCPEFNKKCQISVELDIEPYVPDIPDNYKIMQHICPNLEKCTIFDICPVLSDFRKNFYSTT